MEKDKKLTTESYKGVRDFYPEGLKIQKYIFNTWRKTVELFGYTEYGASVLEPADLYKAKSGEEIVNDQTYTFLDRGQREVTLRPEMTPTLARMIAAKKRELSFPLRWFSIPNLFRYENPQRGRTREHWQLNVDIFGIEGIWAEVEIIQIASKIMTSFGLKETDFEIRLNSRKLINYISCDVANLSDEQSRKLSKLIDKKSKMPADEFNTGLKEIVGNNFDLIITLLNSKNFEEFTSKLPKTSEENEGLKEINEVIKSLDNVGIKNVRFDQTLMRGFDYYTGIVFEVFDLNPKNKRSVFGGGRYNDLLSIFGTEKVSAVGFGAGDVVMQDILETYNLLPNIKNGEDVAICPTGELTIPYSFDIAEKIREGGFSATVDSTDKKIGDKIKQADKRGAEYIVVIGDDELKSGKLKLKKLSNGTEKEANEDNLISLLK